MKTFLCFTIAVLTSVFSAFADPLEDTYEAELMQKCNDLAAGKKNDTQKNLISKFLKEGIFLGINNIFTNFANNFLI